MKYVKHFTINGINTTQVGCIELNGRPNAATAGAVGLLGIDVTSATHDVYKCVAVNGSIYTWELLSSGMSVLSANITGEGGLTKTFPYSDLRIPNNYLIKVGDLILDSEGYLYQISAIGAESCDTTYTTVHLAGGSNGKDYKLQIVDGQLQLVTENGAVISTIDYSTHDDATIVKNADGKTRVIGVYTIGGSLLRFFVGTQAEYDALENKNDLFAILTDDPAPSKLNGIAKQVANIIDGTQSVGSASTLSSKAVLYGSNYHNSNGTFTIPLAKRKTYVVMTNVLATYETMTLQTCDLGAADKYYSTKSANGYYCLYTNGTLTIYKSDGSIYSGNQYVYIREI